MIFLLIFFWIFIFYKERKKIILILGFLAVGCWELDLVPCLHLGIYGVKKYVPLRIGYPRLMD
jgi:hypothetical protein